MYQMDIHIHTKESSYCARVAARDVVHLYKEKGYQGLIITDHYNREFFDHFPTETWKEKVDHYLEGYRQAKTEGEKLGMDIFLGIEFRSVEHINDFLIFGLTERFLYEREELFRLSIEEASEIFKNAGALVIQAHPMRTDVNVLADPACIDGIEVYNGNHQWSYDAGAAEEAAEKYSFIALSGSDFHMTEDLARGGIVFEDPVTGYEDLLRKMKGREIIELIRR